MQRAASWVVVALPEGARASSCSCPAVGLWDSIGGQGRATADEGRQLVVLAGIRACGALRDASLGYLRRERWWWEVVCASEALLGESREWKHGRRSGGFIFVLTGIKVSTWRSSGGASCISISIFERVGGCSSDERSEYFIIQSWCS